MGTRTRSSHLWFLLCFAGFLSLSLLRSGGSIYTHAFIILALDILKDKAVVVWKNLRETLYPGIVDSDLLVKIDSLGQGDRTVEEYCEEFGVLWNELETLRPLPVCTCGAKCFCSDALLGEGKKRMELKLWSFLKGLNDGSRIISLHPCCLKLKVSVSDEGRRVTLNLCETVPKKCKKCKGKKNNIKGWSCVSSDEKYCFHVSCFKGLVVDKGKHYYFSKGNRDRGKKQREMVQAGRSSKGWGKKTKMFINIATVVLELLGPVIFGTPPGGGSLITISAN